MCALTTLAATAVVALAPGLACATLVVLQDRRLVAGSVSSADQQVAVVTARLRTGATPAGATTAVVVARAGGDGEDLVLLTVPTGATAHRAPR